MKKIFLFLIGLLIILTPNFIYSLEPGLYDYATYWKYSGSSTTFGWTPSSGTTESEIVVVHAETNTEIALGRTANNELTFQLPRVGHYILKVRCCNEAGCSSWSLSTNPLCSKVNGQPKAWWVYGQIPPVQGLDID